MSEEIEIKTKSDVMDLVFKLTRFEMQYPNWVKRESLDAVNKEIVDKIREKMEKKGYSKKIIERVRAEFVTIDTDGFVEIDIISDYETDEAFDVAKMMEEGRIAYRVVPIIKKFLHWITLGVSIFAKKSDIPAKPAGDDVKDIMEEMEDVAQDRLDDATDNLLAHSLEN